MSGSHWPQTIKKNKKKNLHVQSFKAMDLATQFVNCVEGVRKTVIMRHCKTLDKGNSLRFLCHDF